MTKHYSEADVGRLWQEHTARHGVTDKREALLGAVVDGKRRIVVPGRPNDVYVTLDNRSFTTVRRGAANIADEFGKRVWIGKEPGNSYDSLLEPVIELGGTGGGRIGGVASHAAQHTLKLRWRQDAISGDGVDPALIGQHQITDLLVMPTSPASFTVRVLAGFATVNGTPVEVEDGVSFALDDSQVPAGAGDAVICRLEIDDTGAFHASYGSDYAEPVPDVDALSNAPAADPDRNTIAYIWLPYGATAVERNYILPAPLAERTGGKAGGGASAFTDLTDVPGSYSGQGSKLLAVKGAEDGVEFVTPSSIGIDGNKRRMVATVAYDKTLGSSGTFDTNSADDSGRTGISAVGAHRIDVELINGRGNVSSSGGNLNVLLALNGDTTAANYDFQQLVGGGSSATAADSAAGRWIAVVPGSDAAANRVGYARMSIGNGAGYKEIQAITTQHHDSNYIAVLRTIMWVDTSVITRLQLAIDNATDTFATGTRLVITVWKEEKIGGIDTSDLNISSTPTDAELTAEFGSASTLGDGYFVAIDDNGGGANEWLCWTHGGDWWGVQATKLT